MFPQSLIPRSLTSSFAKRPKKNFNEVSFEVTDKVFTVKWKEETDEIIINCGLDGVPRMTECEIKGYPYKIWAYAFMKDGFLNAVVKPLNTLSTQYFTFDFSDNIVKIQIKGTPSFPEFIKKNAGTVALFEKCSLIKKVCMKLLDMLLQTTEMPVKYRTKK
jgi:hypothetical protein